MKSRPPPNLFRTIASLCAGFWLLVTLAPSALAMDAKCRALFKEKKYMFAAQCFERAVKKVEKNKQLAGVSGMLKDRFLRNAAVSYSRAGDSLTDLSQRGFLKEKAIELLNATQTKGYCKATNRCTRNKAFIVQIKKEIQYGLVIVFTGKADATITVEGYKLKKVATQTFNQQLRPGKYTITIKKKGSKDKVKKITLKPSTSALIDAKPAEIRIRVKRIIVAKKIPPLVLVGYIAGGALIVAGAIIAAVGYSGQSELNTCRQKADCAQDNDAYHREFDQAGTLILLGYIGAATGALVLGGGVLAHSFANSAANKTPPKTNQSISLGSFGLP